MRKVGSKKQHARETRSTTKIEIVKPSTDLRLYRVVVLSNGITAMLISDASDVVSPDSDSQQDSLTDSSNSEPSREEGEGAAALCVGLGSFCDPLEVPGLAHFLEHMVFMGSKKFPKENFWDEFLAKHGGESNAWTDCERTCFFFMNQQSTFVKALDIFAQFFICPLFNKDSVDKEISAVDNEYQTMGSKDGERMRNIISHILVEEGHPMKKFMAGNKKSLKDDPEENNINVYEMLHAFYKRMYSAHYMTLVVHSRETLDEIEQNVMRIYTKIENNQIPPPKYITPPFQLRNFNKVIKVIPMEDICKMELIWALPSLMKYYRTRVIEFLSVLIGHEGKGSILSLLRKKNYALEISGGNDMTGFTYNSTWTAFILTVKLTEHGFQHIDEVLDVIFQYIDILKSNLPAHVFEEQRHIEETKCIFPEDKNIYNYVEELAENMHMFPPEHYLCGKTLFFEYNEQLIFDCVHLMRPEVVLLMLYSKSFHDLPFLSVEPWFGTKFVVNDLESSRINRLNSLPPNPDLQLPGLNPYIATDFRLVKARGSTKYPVVVMNEKGCRMWYKRDNDFQSPKVYIYFNLISSAISRTSINLTLADIYLAMLLQQLTETLYSATLAGFEYALESAREGIFIKAGGYSEKIKLVIKDLFTVFFEFELDSDAFQTLVAHLRQLYINVLMKPVELARAVRDSLLERKDSSVMERLEQLENINFSKMEAYIKEFHSTLFIEGFVSGNIKSEDVVEIGRLALHLVDDSLPPNKFPQPNTMALPKGEFKCLVPAINEDDTNSCVMQYYQQGLGTFANVCLNDILKAAMDEPLFHTLRTEHQCAYSVDCMPLVAHGVLSFILVVESQANKFRMEEVDELMTQFVKHFEKNLEEMSTDKFQDLVNYQISVLADDDGDLLDQSDRFWAEISKQSYVFDRKQKELKAIEKMKHKDLLQWYQNSMLNQKRKLSLMIQGSTSSQVQNQASWFTLPTLSNLITNFRTCVPNFARHHPTLRQGAFSPLKGVAETLPSLSNPAAQHTKHVKPVIEEGTGHIRDLKEFKSSLHPLPNHIINK